MDEEQKDKGNEEDSNRDSEDGNESETNREIKRINSETERLNKAIAENENVKARAKLAGVTAGAPQTEEVKEETPQEYAKKVMSGEIQLK